MKKNTFQQIALWLNVCFAVLCVIGEATLIQLMPFVVVIGLLYGMIYRGKDFKVALVVISVIMAIANFSYEAELDTLAWVVNTILVLI